MSLVQLKNCLVGVWECPWYSTEFGVCGNVPGVGRIVRMGCDNVSWYNWVRVWMGPDNVPGTVQLEWAYGWAVSICPCSNEEVSEWAMSMSLVQWYNWSEAEGLDRLWHRQCPWFKWLSVWMGLSHEMSLVRPSEGLDGLWFGSWVELCGPVWFDGLCLYILVPRRQSSIHGSNGIGAISMYLTTNIYTSKNTHDSCEILPNKSLRYGQIGVVSAIFLCLMDGVVVCVNFGCIQFVVQPNPSMFTGIFFLSFPKTSRPINGMYSFTINKKIYFRTV
jgi:hypothetical protein